MIQVYFVSKEDYEAFASRLYPHERFTDMRLLIPNWVIGHYQVVAPSDGIPDTDIPGMYNSVLARDASVVAATNKEYVAALKQFKEDNPDQFKANPIYDYITRNEP